MSTRAISTANPFRLEALAATALTLALCVWAGHYLLLSTASYIVPGRASDLDALIARAAVTVTGILLCLGIYALLGRKGERRMWCLLLQAFGLSVIGAGVLVLVGKVAFATLTTYYADNPEQFFEPNATGWLFIGYLWMMLAWSALYAGAVAIGEMRRRDAQLAAMREAGRQARLIALRLQINPHFLFNTLNTLAGFIVLDRKDESEGIVLNLSRFFRHTLTHTASQLVALGEEIDMLRMYLEIETSRFHDRLRVRYDVATGCEAALVPGLILLPLAENSIRHALARSEVGIQIGIGARREGAFLLLWLQDDGPPQDVAGTVPGVGLAGTRQQLTALYGGAATLEAGPTSSGWRNIIRMPWREAVA